MDWERASPSEAVAGDKKNKCSSPQQPTDLSNNNNPTTGQLSRKHKPIPPPLDLSIGATNLNNLSLHQHSTNSQNSNHNHLNNLPSHYHHHPSSYLGSPKFATDSDSFKSLPYRKRWLSWSHVTMSGEESPLLPLHSGMNSTEGENSQQQSSAHHQSSSSSSAYPPNTNYRAHYGTVSGGSTNNNGGLSIQTPTAFFTPNEPSPKFMNSPVFSYSGIMEYNGPFSPMRSTLFPPSSPFTNLSLNTPGGPMSLAMSNNNTSCFNNMIPSTLLSPAPSQSSTNSLSYEDVRDLAEKPLNCFTPVWNIFMSGTKVRFSQTMNSMDWVLVDQIAQQPNLIDPILNFKGDYSPNGLEVRTLVVTSSSKERIQITFCPVGDLGHPQIEIDAEPSHPFMVDKKGIGVCYCSVKPEIFQETYGVQCMQLELGDICLNVMSSNRNQQQQQPPSIHVNNQQTPPTHIPMVSFSNHNSTTIFNNNNINNTMNGSLATIIKSESGVSIDEKSIPISVLPQNQILHHHHHLHQQNHHHQHQQLSPANHGTNANSMAKKFNLPISGSGALPLKRSKDSSQMQEQKGRRPMNAFLLFAKDKRPELIQQYPGKDNRSISCLLGEAWANLSPHEKEKYSKNAKDRADEQKKNYPDCWKRNKRSQSTSS